MFEEELKDPKRVITIDKKLEVLSYYEELLAEKEEAKALRTAPRPVGMNAATRKKHREAKHEANKKLKRNLQKMCETKFPFVKGCRVLKWRRAARAEGWAQLPVQLKSRISCTSNGWRKRFGLAMKGRKLGGGMPWELQKELDLLMSEMTCGRSDVSERREIVTVEDIVSHPEFEVHKDF